MPDRATTLRNELRRIDKRQARTKHKSEIALRMAAIAWVRNSDRSGALDDFSDPNDTKGRRLDRALQRAAVRFVEQHPEMTR